MLRYLFMRKRRIIFIYLLIILVIYFIFSSYQSSQLDELKRKAKLLSLNAETYNPICKIPDLQIINHEKSAPGKIFFFLNIYKKIIILISFFVKEKQCRLKQNWGYLDKNVWHFIPSIRVKLNQFDCQYRSIIRIDDTKYKFGKWYAINEGQLILEEVFEVACKRIGSIKKIEFDNLYIQLVNKLNVSRLNAPTDQAGVCKPVNVILLSYDSVSRSSWIKRVPKSTQYALDIMKFEMLKGYNIGKLDFFFLKKFLIN